MPIPHRNIAADQTQISTIGDYVDRAEIERLLNVEYAPYERDGVIWHRYRIDTDKASGVHRVYAPRAITDDEKEELSRKYRTKGPQSFFLGRKNR